MFNCYFSVKIKQNYPRETRSTQRVEQHILSKHLLLMGKYITSCLGVMYKKCRFEMRFQNLHRKREPVKHVTFSLLQIQKSRIVIFFSDFKCIFIVSNPFDKK